MTTYFIIYLIASGKDGKDVHIDLAATTNDPFFSRKWVIGHLNEKGFTNIVITGFDRLTQAEYEAYKS